MTNFQFEVLSIDEAGKEAVEGTFPKKRDAIHYAGVLANTYGPTKHQDLDFPDRVVKITIRQVWVLNN
jgi:hypothetical protein